MRLLDVHRGAAQKHEKLLHEGPADQRHEDDDPHDQEGKRDQSGEAPGDLVVLQAVGDGAAHEAGDPAHEDEPERLLDEAERADDEPRRDEDPDHRPDGEHTGAPALDALAPALGELPGVLAGAHRISPSGSIFSWMRRRARRNMRDTCTCEMPSFFAISTWVMPSR